MTRLPKQGRLANPAALAGQQIVFTGRLATLSRGAAYELVARHGGVAQRSVSAQTTLLVLGQGDWPLLQSGRLTRNLRTARRLQAEGRPLAIVDEYALLACLGLEDRNDGASRRFTLLELASIVGVSAARARCWVAAGLLSPREVKGGVEWFDYQQLSSARLLARFDANETSRRRLRRSLRQLARLLPDRARLLAELSQADAEGRLLWRNESGQLLDGAGQIHFDFNQAGESSVQWTPRPDTTTDWFAQGVAAEDEGNLNAAVAAYREAAAANPADADAWFNLGNVLTATQQYDEAIASYEKSLELNATHAEAWNNLGAALAGAGRYDEACRAFESAVEISPLYGDAHYNLADALDLLGNSQAACQHWRAYLRGDCDSDWADYARLRLAEYDELRLRP